MIVERAWNGEDGTDPVATLRVEHATGRSLARRLLAQRAGCPPDSIRFELLPTGRPVAIAPRAVRRLSFSVSHSDGIALCAVTGASAVGVDVESLRHIGPDPMAIAAVACSPAETHELLATPPERRAARMLALWTVKEALAKATGLGAQLRFSRITAGPPAQFHSAASWTWAPREGRSLWWLTSLHPTRHHVAAVAVMVAGPDPAEALGSR